MCTQDDSLWQGTQKLQNTGEPSEGPPVCVRDDGAVCWKSGILLKWEFVHLNLISVPD